MHKIQIFQNLESVEVTEKSFFEIRCCTGIAADFGDLFDKMLLLQKPLGMRRQIL